MEYFRKALARDPNYARAHLGVADANVGLGVYQYIPTIEAAREAAAALEEAERLRPDLALVHVSWGQLKLYLRPDWHEAEPHFQRALAIDPNEPLLADFGQHDEAVRRLQRVVELTQSAPRLVGIYARALWLAERRDAALAVRAEVREGAKREYVGPAALLMMLGLDRDDDAALAALIEANVAAMTGPTAILTTVVRELTPLLDHPRLGPLVRKLTPWATAPGTAR